jgi:hypothetical protein
MFIKKVNFRLRAAFTLLFLIVLSGKIFGQNDFKIEPPTYDTTKSIKDSVYFWHGLYINPVIQGGLGKPYSSSDFKSGFIIDAGAEACYMFDKHFGISLGAQFEQYSYKYSYSNVYNPTYMPVIHTINRPNAYDSVGLGGYTTNVTYTFAFVRIPLLMRYISSLQNKVGFYAEAGIIANLLVSAKESGTASETEYDFHQDANTPWYNNNPGSAVNSADISNATPDAAKFNLSLHAGIGIIIPAGRRVSVVLAYCADLALMNGGTGANDIVKFSDGSYSFYGQSSIYGTFNTLAAIKASVILKLGRK